MHDILALLVGAQIFDGSEWRIYDESGTELDNPAGLRALGKMGVLLMQAQVGDEVLSVVFGGGGTQANHITARNSLGEEVEVDDEEIIEFLAAFAMWRSAQSARPALVK